MAEEYIELILRWAPNADIDKVRRWFRQRGIDCSDMQSGLLIRGSKKQMAAALSSPLEETSRPSVIPVPRELAADVSSIMVPSPRRYHA